MAEQGEQPSKEGLDQPLTIEQRFMQRLYPDSPKDKDGEQPEGEAPQKEEKPTVGSDEVDPKPEEKPEDKDLDKDALEDDPARKVEAVDQTVLDNTFYEVDINGEKSEVSITDMVRSYQQQADYTQKTTALSDERKEFNEAIATASGEIQNARQGVIDTESYLIQGDLTALRKLQQTDWTTLKTDDPDAYMLRRVDLQDAEQAVRARVARVDSFKVELAEARESDRAVRVAEAVEEVKGLIPELADPATAAPFAQGLVDYAVTQGISAEEAHAVEDARYFVILNKARKYDELQEKTGEARKKLEEVKVTRVVQSGGAAPSPETVQGREVAERRAKLKESGSQRDLAAVFLDGINKQRGA